MSQQRVLIVGGGIAGLAAAAELVDHFQVELREASPRVGGKIVSSSFGGIDHVDEGADAYLTRVPEAVQFANKVGVTQLTSPTGAPAMVWHDGMHDIPAGIVLGMPASVRPFVTTSLLSWRGKLRAGLEPFLPRTDPDDSLGRLMRARFGDEVHERLVDSLVGSIYATDTDNSSLEAVPQLSRLAASNRSLLWGGLKARRLARETSDTSPIFDAPVVGMGGLVDAAARYVTGRGAQIVTDSPVSTIEHDTTGWRVDDDHFEGIVLATPAKTTAPLLSEVAPTASTALAKNEHCDIIMVRLSIPGSDWPDHLLRRSGYLVPKPDQRFVTAASFASQKWAHWSPPDDSQILRVSLGRDGLPVRQLDDDAVVAAVTEELGHHLGFDVQPATISITRWLDGFPQYRPHHHERVASIESTLPGGIEVAGASYRGIGIPACIASGQRAASRIQESIALADGFL